MIKEFINEGKINVTWNDLVNLIFLIEVIAGIWLCSIDFFIAVMVIFMAVICTISIISKTVTFRETVLVIFGLAVPGMLCCFGFIMVILGPQAISGLYEVYPSTTSISIASFVSALLLIFFAANYEHSEPN